MPGRIGKAIGKGGFRVGHVARKHGVKTQLPERDKPDAQILVTGLKENARAAVAELELLANLKLHPEHILVSLRIKREEHILEGCRPAWIEREFGVRFETPSGNGPLVLEGGVGAMTEAEAFIDDLVASQRPRSAVRSTPH